MRRRVAIDARKLHDFGIGTYIRGLVTALVALPREETLVLFGPPDLREHFGASPDVEVLEETTPGYSLSELYRLPRLLQKSGADLLHVPHYVLPFTSLPSVVTIQDLIHLDPRIRRRAGERLYARWMIGRAARTARRIITTTDRVAQDVISRFPAAAGKVTTIPLAVDEQFGSLPDATPIRLPESVPPQYLLFVGNDKPHKNLPLLLDAVGAARRVKPDIHLIVCGPASRAVRDGVTFLGFVPSSELRQLYRGATALVVPSLHEGFGLPLLEAMASGCPVIRSRDRALAEVAGDAALEFDESSRDDLIAALLRIWDDAALRSQLVDRGRRRAAEFSWNRCAEATLAVYRDVLSES